MSAVPVPGEPISIVGYPDPHVLRPPGSGSISQRYGSQSGSFTFRTDVLCGLK